MKGNKIWMVIVLTMLVFAGLVWVCSTWSSAKYAGGEVTSYQVQKMLESHPYKQTAEEYMEELIAAIDETSKCGQTCITCADACVGEKDTMLTACIRLNSDCADICYTTNRLLSRLTETPMNVVRSQLQTCIVSCQACAEECMKHADRYEHCRICANTCVQCSQACNDLLAATQQ